MTIEISNALGRNSPANEDDVRRVKTALNRVGYYVPYKKIGMTGIPDTALFDAVTKFQENYELPPTGVLKPGDITLKKLGGAVEAVPDGDSYIWHTVGDEDVRDSHAALDGMVHSWGDSPRPGEEFGCRCWAELVVDEIEREELPPPPEKKIPGTDIPDQGIPEQGFPGSPKYDPHRIPPRDNPDYYLDRIPQNMDPHMELPQIPIPWNDGWDI